MRKLTSCLLVFFLCVFGYSGCAHTLSPKEKDTAFELPS